MPNVAITLAPYAASAAAIIAALLAFMASRGNKEISEEQLLDNRQKIFLESAYRTAEEAERRWQRAEARIADLESVIAKMQEDHRGEIDRIKSEHKALLETMHGELQAVQTKAVGGMS